MKKWYLVSQNKSHQYEFNKQILWSPKRKRDGSRAYSYDCMQSLKVGDIIVNVYHQHIMGISVVIKDAYSQPRPVELNNKGWASEGWQVDLKIKRVQIPLAPERSFFADSNNRKQRHDAFNTNGTINQGYLFELNQIEISHIKDLLLTFFLDIEIK
ncbi:hypothetical protein [Nicoliella lavandulae]|uniref:EVE domain-containing protein n=1 Tax=Nicoliella lavandulae TaxID=3082954 RepID=A0ABU8SM40_9LACO